MCRNVQKYAKCAIKADLVHKIVHLALHPLFLVLGVTRDGSSSSSVSVSSAHPALRSVSPPPRWKTRRGRRTRSAWDVSWRAASAHGSRRRALRRARPRRQRRGMPPCSRREGDPRAYRHRLLLRCRPRRSAHESGTSGGGGGGFGGGGRGSRAWVEGCHTCCSVLGASSTTSANPARERRRDQGGEEEKKGTKAVTKPSLRVPPSFEQWEARAVFRCMRGPQGARLHARRIAPARLLATELPRPRAELRIAFSRALCISTRERVSGRTRRGDQRVNDWTATSTRKNCKLLSHIACWINVIVIY